MDRAGDSTYDFHRVKMTTYEEARIDSKVLINRRNRQTRPNRRYFLQKCRKDV
jgi:hypothetical protein